MDDWWSQLFDFSDYGALLALLQNSILAGAVLGIVGGLIGVFVMSRDLAFAVHGISELSFAGAAAGLLFGVGVVEGSIVGSLIAAALIGVLGTRARDRNSITAVLMPFGLGLGILCLALYPGRASNRFGLLTGQIVAVDDPRLGTLAVIGAIVVIGLLVIWRPLTFASVDAEVAIARGVPARALSLVFMLLLGLAVAVGVQVVGALLVLSVLVTPAAAALRVSSSPFWVPVLSMLFATVSLVGGIMLALGASVPHQPLRHHDLVPDLPGVPHRLGETGSADASPRRENGGGMKVTGMKRNTWQREAVREALGGTEGFVSAQALHAAMKGTGSEVGLATVYRALADLATEGDADSLQSDGESLYRACTPGSHHHHLICRRCGTTVEIAADPGGDLGARGRRRARIHPAAARRRRVRLLRRLHARTLTGPC